MPSEESRTIIFAFVVCLVCSLCLAVIAQSLKPRQEANKETFRVRNVLKAFDYQVVDGSITNDALALSPEAVMQAFESHISEVIVDLDGQVIEGASSSDPALESDMDAKKLLPLYLWRDRADGPVSKVSFPISGYGLWGTVYGYVALEGDMSTIAGITFYDHKETPGLGAEVEKEWFQSQFKGKKLFDLENNAVADFKVVKSKTANDLLNEPFSVGGITAATITANGVQNFLVRDMKRYEPYLKTLRKNQG